MSNQAIVILLVCLLIWDALSIVGLRCRFQQLTILEKAGLLGRIDRPSLNRPSFILLGAFFVGVTTLVFGINGAITRGVEDHIRDLRLTEAEQERLLQLLQAITK